ncbi:ABC transporter permease subunit [Auraticoccus sp. F435]|uniref:ABC transporter permease subunit n=1 Tax=Auraticoccus cholistanensis TaxID=2656650 RepID=A0A6A9UTS0_9ACTN|nr:ABC transporter permease [Auraticoccus cholistanensis]MVA76223.1 ABC transporter permease subunit [Auraticoccus cholistanensis]
MTDPAGIAVSEFGTQPAGEERSAGQDQVRSLWSDAWDSLRRNPLFWVSSALILVFLLMAAAPQLFTSADPFYGDLAVARQPPSAEHVFGTSSQGYDVYARVVYGARASIMVGLLTTVGTVVVGSVVGLVSGFYGGWLDALLSRIGEVFFAIPLLLAGILAAYLFQPGPGSGLVSQVLRVVAVLVVFGWPSLARLMRGSVLQVKPNDYVNAARALGASAPRLIVRHILPNAVAPMIVVATINLGTYIAVEATLAFLGIGLRDPAISWGNDISIASSIGLVRAAPHMLLFPSLFLSLTVLAFIMLGDAVRDAIDPKLR